MFLRKEWRSFAVIILCAIGFACAQGATHDVAELVLMNGKIVTVDADESIAEAVAVTDGKISAVGTNDEIREWTGVVRQNSFRCASRPGNGERCDWERA